MWKRKRLKNNRFHIPEGKVCKMASNEGKGGYKVQGEKTDTI